MANKPSAKKAIRKIEQMDSVTDKTVLFSDAGDS